MIDALDQTYQAREQVERDFSPMPKGEYSFVVSEIRDWKPSTKNVKVIKRDVNGTPIKDEKGQNVTELVKNLTIYNCTLVLDCIENDKYNGRKIFYNLTTHPNMPWSIPSFLYAVGLKELKAREIQSKCLGCKLNGLVDVEKYTKKFTDKETGLEREEETERNVINRFKPYTFLNQTTDAPVEYGAPTLNIDADSLPF